MTATRTIREVGPGSGEWANCMTELHSVMPASPLRELQRRHRGSALPHWLSGARSRPRSLPALPNDLAIGGDPNHVERRVAVEIPDGQLSPPLRERRFRQGREALVLPAQRRP